MNPQGMFTELAAAAKRPGFVKTIAGQLAIAFGARMVADVAAEAEERTQAAMAELERITREAETAQRRLHGHTEEFEAIVKGLIAAGVYDPYVIARAAQKGWTPPGVPDLPEPDGYVPIVGGNGRSLDVDRVERVAELTDDGAEQPA